MGKRIKVLYIITIIAIMALLGMQMYWLLGRYEFSLREYERKLAERIASCVEEYNSVRENSADLSTVSLKENDRDAVSIPTFSLEQEYGDTVKTKRTSRINTYVFSAYELLGLEPGTPLTEEQKKKAAELAEAQMTAPTDSISMVFDASGAKDEKEAWLATQNVLTERKSPFSAEGVDSVLNKAGIKARINLVRNDGMIWQTAIAYDTSVFTPHVSMTVPYSQLQGKQSVSCVRSTLSMCCRACGRRSLSLLWSPVCSSSVSFCNSLQCLSCQGLTNCATALSPR